MTIKVETEIRSVGDCLFLEKLNGAIWLVHKPTKIKIRAWAYVEGMEEGVWHLMNQYAKRVIEIDFVRWDTEDPDFLYPCDNFVKRYMDSVGLGHKTVEEISAQLMEKIMRESA